MRFPFPPASLALAACGVVLAGCAGIDRFSYGVTTAISPYKVEIVQGNFVSKEQVTALRKGMSRIQVRDILGTPLVTDAFHKDRWDYVFTIRREGVHSQERRLAVYFSGDTLDHWEGDEMPTEADFVATLDAKRRGSTIPQLEASEDKLRQFAAENKSQPAPAAPTAAAPAVSYPPLEPPQR
ncbi:MAG TPA: outer membrane protein assembly factor BamE [Ramlibacter sp.]|jgi:outer membrane protein assembly factor BamE